MNIFYLDQNPIQAAMYHNNSHVVKMVLETAQILSTTHRFLDGELHYELSKKGRKLKRYKLPDSRESILYKATHINHGSVRWVRQSSENYKWLYSLFEALLNEFEFRFGKEHKSKSLLYALSELPKNLPVGDFSELYLAMPDYCKIYDELNNTLSIESYRNYYILEKSKLNKYSKREIPYWLI